jgi:hypothetical protein
LVRSGATISSAPQIVTEQNAISRGQPSKSSGRPYFALNQKRSSSMKLT